MEGTLLLVAILLLEEEEEEELLVLNDLQRMKPNPLYMAREKEGFQNILIQRHLLKDDIMFRKFFRLNIDQFNYVLSCIESDLVRQSCGKVKQPISPAEKLGLMLRFLATGESYASLAFEFRISPSYISRIVKQVAKLCSERLPPIFMPTPSVQQLVALANDFEEKWNFPNCISAVDGKHVRIFCPVKSGSQFFNYKDYFSIVLLAFVDANYKFVMVDIGSYGREGDSGILVLPYVVIGDKAFKLSTHMMKPFVRNDAHVNNKKAIFNYRLSCARRVSENSFAFLSQIFRIFYTPIAVNPEVTDCLIMTACCLHNMLRDAFLEANGTCFFDISNSEQLPTQNLIPLVAKGGFGNIEGFAVRERFTDYFNSSIGSLPWQMKQVTRTDQHK